MQEKDTIRRAVVLGSFKPGKWENIKESTLTLSGLGIIVVSPRDTNLVSIPLPDNPDFYFLQGDLDEVGLTPKDLEDKTTLEVSSKLDCRKLQTRVCKSMIETGEAGLTYVVLHNNELGKTTAYELSIAILFGNKVALNQKIEKISVEVKSEIRDFIEQSKSQISIIKQEKLKDLIPNFSKVEIGYLSQDSRRNLIKISLRSLLRNEYKPYKRPVNEFIPTP
jgi:hypothetical protein